MKISFIETEKNYDNNGNNRSWYKISGAEDGDLNGDYAVSTDGSIVNENGENIDDSMADNDSVVIKKELHNHFEMSKAAASLGKLGGRSKSEAKQNAARENGKKGGRPKKVQK